MARTVGINVIYSISPNKATIHPEQMGPRANHYAQCNQRSAARMREIFEQYFPDLIDHAKVMIPTREVGSQFFLKTDTHWNRIGFAVAMAQLREVLTGRTINVQVSDHTVRRKSGTMSNLLLLDHFEQISNVTDDTKSALFDAPIPSLRNTVVVHDSFYGFYKDTKKVFPTTTFFANTNFPQQIALVDKAIREQPKLLMFNSVERAATGRFENAWGTSGGLFGVLMELNISKAKKHCAYNRTLSFNQIGAVAFSKKNDMLTVEKKSAHFFIPANTTKAPSCLRIAFQSSDASGLRIYLPPFIGQTAPENWSRNRYISMPIEAGKNQFEMILPPDRTDRRLRINTTLPLGGTLADLKIELGRLQRD